MKFTFAVCSECGVQSQPILIRDNVTPSFIKDDLEKTGWEVKSSLHLLLCKCPKCKNG